METILTVSGVLVIRPLDDADDQVIDATLRLRPVGDGGGKNDPGERSFGILPSENPDPVIGNDLKFTRDAEETIPDNGTGE